MVIVHQMESNYSHRRSCRLRISAQKRNLFSSLISDRATERVKRKTMLFSITSTIMFQVIDPETGRKLGPGEIGELCVLTHFMMKEYLNRPDETAKTVIDGWLHTGDKGYYDTDENVFVIGRYKELIKYRMAHVSTETGTRKPIKLTLTMA